MDELEKALAKESPAIVESIDRVLHSVKTLSSAARAMGADAAGRGSFIYVFNSHRETLKSIANFYADGEER